MKQLGMVTMWHINRECPAQLRLRNKMRKIIRILLVLVSLCSTANALERFDIITTEELQYLLSQRDANESDFLLINSLDRLIADHHSIPGSINIPWSRVNENTQLLGEDRGKLIITYCMGYR